MSKESAKCIDEVKILFDNWRKTRKTQRVRIPENLWQEAINLLDRYSAFEIIKELHLNNTNFRERIQKQKAKKKSKVKESKSFIQLHLDDKNINSQLSSINFQLEKPDGCKLKMELQSISKNEIHEILQIFMKEGVK